MPIFSKQPSNTGIVPLRKTYGDPTVPRHVDWLSIITTCGLSYFACWATKLVGKEEARTTSAKGASMQFDDDDAGLVLSIRYSVMAARHGQEPGGDWATPDAVDAP